MKNEVAEHNEHVLIMADDRGQLNSHLIRAIANKISRRGLLVTRPASTEELDWEALYSKASELLSQVSAFGQESIEDSKKYARTIVERHLPAFSVSALAQYSKTLNVTRTEEVPAGEILYQELARGQRTAVGKDTAAILAHKLSTQGFTLIRNSANVHLDTYGFMESLTKETVSAEQHAEMWNNLNDPEREDYVLANEPYLRPLNSLLIQQFNSQVASLARCREPLVRHLTQ